MTQRSGRRFQMALNCILKNSIKFLGGGHFTRVPVVSELEEEKIKEPSGTEPVV